MSKKERAVVGVFCLSMLAVAIDGWFRSRDVHERQIELANAIARIESLRLKVQNNADRLDGRTEFMAEASQLLHQKTQDRWPGESMRDWAAELQRRNVQIDVPDVRQLKPIAKIGVPD